MITAPEAELKELAELLRAHLQWQRALGTLGLPAASPELRKARRSISTEAADDAAETRASAAGQASPRASQSGIAEREPPDKAQAPEVTGLASAELASAEPASTELANPEPASAELAQTGPFENALAVAGAGQDTPHRQLALLAQQIAGCQRCRLHEGRTQTVFARGTGSSGVCFVGEGPGEDEDAQGFPFVGKAGQLLDRMIAAMGLSREEVYVCNIVKCRPPRNRKPEPEEMVECVPYLHEQLNLIQPQVIVALGATAVQGLLGTTGGITRLRGNWRLYRGIAVMPTFHPAYLLRNPKAKREVWEDLQAVLRHLGRPVPSRKG